MQIDNCIVNDVNEIIRLHQLEQDFKKRKFLQGGTSNCDASFIKKQVEENQYFKLLMNDKIACIWSIPDCLPEVLNSDADEYTLYISKIIANPDFKGIDYLSILLEWANTFDQNKKYIITTVCAQYEKLIRYYNRLGFYFWSLEKFGIDTQDQNNDVYYLKINL